MDTSTTLSLSPHFISLKTNEFVEDDDKLFSMMTKKVVSRERERERENVCEKNV